MNTNQHEFTYDGKIYTAIKLNGTCDHCAFLHKDCDQLRKRGKIPSCIKKVDKGVKYFCRMVYFDPKLACFYEMMPGANVRYSLDYTTAANDVAQGRLGDIHDRVRHL